MFPEFEETERKINSFYINGNGLAKHKRVMSNQVFIKSSANKLVSLPYILYNLLSFFIYCIGKFSFSWHTFLYTFVIFLFHRKNIIKYKL